MTASALPRRADWRVAAPALALLAGGSVYIGDAVGARMAWLFLVGGALGLALYHASFGFASAWRAFLTEGRGEGLRAQMVMLGLATLLFLPLLDGGTVFGRGIVGAVAPAGIPVALGAALFGIGMQLAGGCASGTLYTVGGGSTKMVFTLLFFMLGALVATFHLPWWLETPSFGAVSLLEAWGLWPALLTQLAVFAAVAVATLAIERRRARGRPAAPAPLPLARRLLSGPWPLLWGAVALALLNAVTLVSAGHPWNVVFGYTLWGAKLATAAGVDLGAFAFWTWPYPSRALAGSVFAETTSTMNFGVLAGAFLAAGLAGRFNPAWRLPWRQVVAAALGGILMGYGARLAFGCNVGAFFSGIASGSLHGWLWFAAGLAGSWLGTRLRPAFGLDGGPLRRPAPQAA
ncbi:MAG TPA: YeeE/YedE family protein [Kiloniellaceae bacterium]|nr:YeeE/YedE family protein [Kiloniellaceae bacterium]